MMGEHLLNGKVLALWRINQGSAFLATLIGLLQTTIITIRLLQTLTSLQRFLTFMAFRIRMGFKVSHSGSWEMEKAQRKSFMYEYAGDSLNAAFSCGKNFEFNIQKSYCSSTTEEYYNFGNWLHENFNEIFNPDLQESIALSRALLDSLRVIISILAHPEINPVIL